MFRTVLAAIALVAVAQAVHATLAPSAPPSIVDAYARASALIDSAIAAHGGDGALRALQSLHVTIEGFDYHRFQSRRLAPPYDSTPRRIEMWTDLASGRLVTEQRTGYPGGFAYASRFVSNGERHWWVDVRNGTYAPRRYPPAAQQLGNLFQVPQGYLHAARESTAPGQRRALGRLRLTNGMEVEGVLFTIPNSTITIGLDPTSHLVRAVLSVAPDFLLGDVAVETIFHDYRPLGGLLLPARVQLWRAGERIRELRYTAAAVGDGVPDAVAVPSPEHVQAAEPPAGDTLRALAPGVWAVNGGGSWGLLVEFADHLVVVDAAPNVTRTMRERAATLAPGKPIRWVVPTHHHDDHFTGVRDYAAHGATTVTTPGNADFFRRLMAAPASSLVPGAAPPQASARLELVSGKRRVFADQRRTLELHDIGPSPHAEEMLVAWIPEEGILFQADLIQAPASGVAQRGDNAHTTTHLAAFIERQGWRVRTFAGAHAFLASPAEFARLVRHPLEGH